MENQSFSGSAQITDVGIKKHFKTFEPYQVIFELVANGLDANCTNVHISVDYTDIGGIENVSILDDGDGIDVNNYKENFGKFNESLKKRNGDKLGSHGRGRLSFHKLCEQAYWYTKRDDKVVQIKISSDKIKQFEGKYLDNTDQCSSLESLNSGTLVELINTSNNNLPEEGALLEKLGEEFGWFLAIHTDIKISLNGSPVTAPHHELTNYQHKVEEQVFDVKIINWNTKPSSEKSFNYFVNDQKTVLTKELSKFNNKPNFYISTYIISPWLGIIAQELLEGEPEFISRKKTISKINNKIHDDQSTVYQNFLRKFVDKEIAKYEDKEYFPNYKSDNPEYAKIRRENTKVVVKDIYYADPSLFNKLNNKQAKILIRLIDKVLSSSDNDSLYDVLEGVLDLAPENMSRLATQIQKSTLDNIIGTIDTLQRRETTVHKLRDIMDNRFKEVLETPDLQKIIENNTWLFGPQYATLGAEENSFTSIAKNLRDMVADKDLISDIDIEEGATVEGINRQVDLFLARKTATFDSSNRSIYKCVIVEIKRPGVSLNKKHMRQLEDYAGIISKHTAFNAANMQFELILIGRKISQNDDLISRNLEDMKHHAEYGLVSNANNIKCYVKDWYTIFNEFDLSNNYLLGTLQTKLESLSEVETEELITDLQTT